MGASSGSSPEERALAAVRASGVAYEVVRHGPVESAADAAAVRGVPLRGLLKTLVVRRAEDDLLLVLVPGDRVLSWSKLRSLLGVTRLSLPDAEVARAATGYERGAITPFGTLLAWPVVADTLVCGQRVSVGGGGRGVAVTLDGDDLVRVVGARVADVTEPASG